MKEHFLTKVNNRILRQITRTDEQLKKLSPAPYMARKATPAEQLEMFKGLTQEQLFELVRRHGEETVNRWLERMNRRASNGTAD